MKKYVKSMSCLILALCFFISRIGYANDDFAVWKESFIKEALSAGVSESTLNKFVPRMSLVPQVVRSDKKQPEFVSTFWDYMDARLTNERIQTGQMLLKRYPTWLARISEQYQVPKEYILAFWGLETNYGKIMGNTNVLDALATLAYNPRRRKFFTKELIAFLKILEQEKWDTVTGSWAGAFGQFQFMPTTFLAYAVDADNNGTRNIMVSMPDAFASAANYLHQMGWNLEEPWGQEVILPQNLNWSKVYEAKEKSVADWAKLGIVPAHYPWRIASLDVSASLILPMGKEGPAFLTFPNFKRVMRWNKSELYALSVCFLADILKGEWQELSRPQTHSRLLTEEVLQIQEHLMKLGYYPETPDGLVGPKTRTAILNFQRDHRIAEDGYPSAKMLDLLKTYNKEVNK